MVEKVKVGDIEVEVKSISYLDAVEIEDLKKTSLKEAVKKMFQSGSNLTPEQIDNMSFRDGAKVQEAIMKFNDLGDFQNPSAGQESNQK